MKLFSTAYAVGAAVLAALNSIGLVDAQQNQPRCRSIYTRKELLSLNAAEWSVVITVTNAMQRDGWFAWFAYMHRTNFGTIHGNSQFFPWHRRFVQDFESVGRRYNPNFIQPYWDEMRDYRAPATSRLLTASWLGSNGRSSDRCVTNGLQAGWTMTYPNNHCLRRNFQNNGNINSWYSPEYINSLVQRSPDMNDFRPGIEFSLHGVVHISIGGDMNTSPSPNDWIFMLHHANIDRLWWQWQQGSGRMWSLNGLNHDGRSMTLDTNIVSYNEPARSVMQLGYGNMCYQYAGSAPALRRRSPLDDISQIIPTSDRSVADSVDGIISNALDSADLAKWFPDLAKKVNNGTVRPSPQSLLRVATKEIPYPSKLTNEWIKMHNYDPAAVAKVTKDADDFVSAMKKAGYRSPY